MSITSARTPAARHPIEDLAITGEIAEGGQGRVHAVATGKLAFKEYHRSTLEVLDLAVLDRLVDFYRTAPTQVRAWLDARTAWPVAVVTGGDGPLGFLMPMAPNRFYETLRVGSGSRRILLGLEHLLNPHDYLSRVGIELSDRDRLLLLRDLAVTLDGLHRQSIAVGDLSPRNVLVDPTREPRCFLLDCDAVCFQGESVGPQLETPDWALPVGEPLGEATGDRYKFGLLVLRLLAGDQSTRDASLIVGTFTGLAMLVEQTLAGAPAVRPLLPEWIDQLTRELPGASAAPPRSHVPVAQPTMVAAPARSGRPSAWIVLLFIVEMLTLLAALP